MPGMVSDRITRKGINTKPTYINYDGKEQVLFVSNRVGYSNIYKMPYEEFMTREKGLEVLVKGERTTEFEAFNLLKSKIDANKHGELLFVAKSQGKDAIYKVDIESGDVIDRLQFDDIVTVFSPNWHPSSEKMVWLPLPGVYPG